MLALNSYGIDPINALKLLEYEDIDWFIEEYSKQVYNKSVRDKIEMVDSIRLAISSTQSKEGHQRYSKWRLDTIDSMHKKTKNKSGIFGRLRSKEKIEASKPKGLFERLKGR